MSADKSKYIRFVKDYNLPVNIFEEDYIDYYRSTYHFWPHEAEKAMETEIAEYGSVEAWLEHYSIIRDNIIHSLENSESYKNFNNCDMSIYDIPNTNTCSERSLYTAETDGEYFLSIDLKKANFQALKYVGVIDDETYNNFIARYGGSEYFVNSKYLRQVIFGKLNPKRTIKVEKYIMYKIRTLVADILNAEDFELFSVNSDEVVYKVNNYKCLHDLNPKSIELLILSELGFEVRVEAVRIFRLPIKNNRGGFIDAYIRYNVHTHEQQLKKASTTFYPQIYKIWKGMTIVEKDLDFFFENQIASFHHPITLDTDEYNRR